MPFCPQCHSEYREGFTVCPPCGDLALVAELPRVDEIGQEEVGNTKAVGTSTIPHLVELGDRSIDLTRVFVLQAASEVDALIKEAGIASVIVPLVGVEFPDQRDRFEVRVRPHDFESAQSILQKAWAQEIEKEGVEGSMAGTDVEACPACGARVALDVEECPECGLVVGGMAAEEAEADAG